MMRRSENRLGQLFVKVGVHVFIAWLCVLARSPALAARFECAEGDVGCLIRFIEAANALEGMDTIVLFPAKKGDPRDAVPIPYVLRKAYPEPDPRVAAFGRNGLPAITDDLEIVGAFTPQDRGRRAVIARAFDPNEPPFRIFHVRNGAQVTLGNLLINGGFADSNIPDDPAGQGGGIVVFNDPGPRDHLAFLHLNAVQIISNHGTWGGGGIAILAHPQLPVDVIIDSCLIALNTASRGNGAGIFAPFQEVLIRGSLQREAVQISVTPVRIIDSKITENEAGGEGGGVFVDILDRAFATFNHIADNVAGGRCQDVFATIEARETPDPIARNVCEGQRRE